MPVYDFSSGFAAISKAFHDASERSRRNRFASSLGEAFAGENPDYAMAAKAAFGAGEYGAGLSLARMGQEATASRQFNSLLSEGGPPMALAGNAPMPSNGNPEREREAFSYFHDQGHSPVAASAIAGGFGVESNLNPAAVNPRDGRDGSNSIGIGQWNGPRAAALKQFAQQNGRDPNDFRTQLEFTQHELTTTEAGTSEKLFAAKTPQEAAAAFAGYERPAGWTPNNPQGAMHFDRRVANAQRLYGAHGGGHGEYGQQSSEDRLADHVPERTTLGKSVV